MRRSTSSLHRRAARARAGVTLIELLISASLIGFVFGVIGTVTLTTSSAYRASASTALLDDTLARSLDRIATELDTAILGALAPMPTAAIETHALTYQRCTGFAAGAKTAGGDVRLELRYDPAEADNGLDDDADGLVDEGQIVWILGPATVAPLEVVWVNGVAEQLEGEVINAADDNGNLVPDERGFLLTLTGEVLTVRMTLEGVDSNGRLLTRTGQTSVRIRN